MVLSGMSAMSVASSHGLVSVGVEILLSVGISTWWDPRALCV